MATGQPDIRSHSQPGMINLAYDTSCSSTDLLDDEPRDLDFSRLTSPASVHQSHRTGPRHQTSVFSPTSRSGHRNSSQAIVPDRASHGDRSSQPSLPTPSSSISVFPVFNYQEDGPIGLRPYKEILDPMYTGPIQNTKTLICFKVLSALVFTVVVTTLSAVLVNHFKS